jgi:hypothetical protein
MTLISEVLCQFRLGYFSPIFVLSLCLVVLVWSDLPDSSISFCIHGINSLTGWESIEFLKKKITQICCMYQDVILPFGTNDYIIQFDR